MIKKLCLSILVIFLQACQKHEVPPVPLRPALVMKVGAESNNNAMVLVGEVKSRYESNQGFRIKGKIVERKAEVGSLVKKGQVLARLDATDANLSAQAANADVHAAEANYALAVAEVERQRKLVEKQFISQSALDVREAELKTAAARLQQAKAQASVSGNQTRYNALVADRDGVVTQIRAEPGQVVDAGEMIAQIADTKQIEVLVAVPESHMAHLKVGDNVTIKLWANREEAYEGRVREIAPEANSNTRTFDVRVAFASIDENVKLGMTAGVRFAEVASGSLMIPTSALTQMNGKNSVWVIDNKGVANPREVEAGQFTEDGVPIVGGLQTGEVIAIAGVHTLVKGQKVKPLFEKSNPEGVQ